MSKCFLHWPSLAGKINVVRIAQYGLVSVEFRKSSLEMELVWKLNF